MDIIIYGAAGSVAIFLLMIICMMLISIAAWDWWVELSDVLFCARASLMFWPAISLIIWWVGGL